jgi:hypothetical protein
MMWMEDMFCKYFARFHIDSVQRGRRVNDDITKRMCCLEQRLRKFIEMMECFIYSWFIKSQTCDTPTKDDDHDDASAMRRHYRHWGKVVGATLKMMRWTKKLLPYAQLGSIIML